MAKTLVDVLTELNIQLQPSGERLVARCPLHDNDNGPSFTVYPNDTYFCFGCRAWGDAVKFLVDYKDWSIDQAMEYVGQDYRTPRARTIIKVRNKQHLYPFLYEVAKAYHEFLLRTPGAIAYLLSRGLTEDTIRHFLIGYTDGQVLNLHYAEEYAMAEEYSVINKNGFELLSHRITIPDLVGAGECGYIIGRTVTHDKVKYLGIRTPKPIFGLYEVRNSPILFLAEGQFDWLVLRQWGLPAIVTGGTHITKSNLVVLKDRYVVIVPDNDPPGMAAAQSLNRTLPNSMILDYTKMGVKDIGEAGPIDGAKKQFAEIVREQVPEIFHRRFPTGD